MPRTRRESQVDTRRALDRLRALRPDPEARRAFAVELLGATEDVELLAAAIDVLVAQPGSDLRVALHARYEALNANPKKRDPGGFLRAAIIRTLQPVAGADDALLFERACDTHEATPADVNGPAILRAAGLAALAAVDAPVAALRAAGLLARTDRVSPMTGEPAVTAARVLAALGETAALYLYAETALTGDGPMLGEVIAAAVRGLGQLPAGLLLALAERPRARDGMVAAACVDAVIGHAADATLSAWLSRLLRTTPEDDLYAFAITSIVANRAGQMLPTLFEVARHETAGARLRILDDSLAMLGKEPGAVDALAVVRAKLEALMPG